jgi:hypothetical protein
MLPPSQKTQQLERTMWIIFGVTAVIKLLLAWVVPLTADEAYFILWGKHLDYGYYDHGAMAGWWMWAMLQFSDAIWWLRLPAVLTSQFAGWALWQMLHKIDRDKAALAVTIYLVSPINVFKILFTTDTPLLFFSIVSIMLAMRGLQRDRLSDFWLSGLALGFAFLSKYFAVLLGIAYAVILLLGCRRPRIRALLILLSGIIPGVGINILWNVHHWWSNVLFNLVTRQDSSGISLKAPIEYLATLAILAGPGVLWVWWQRRSRKGSWKWRDVFPGIQANGLVVPVFVFLVPLFFFLPVSLFHEIGVHWILSFFPMLAALLFVRFRTEDLQRMVRPTIWWTGIPTLIILASPLILDVVAQHHRRSFSIILAIDPVGVIEELAPYQEQYLLTTSSYAKSASFGYFTGQNVPVIGTGSYHGRQDDLLTDFREFDGRDLMIVTARPERIPDAVNWFAETELVKFTVGGVDFFAILGREFNFSAYRENVLQVIADRYYRMPDWLRPFATTCFFTDRYDLELPPAP